MFEPTTLNVYVAATTVVLVIVAELGENPDALVR